MQFIAPNVPRGRRYTPKELAGLLRTTPGTLEVWRVKGRGPKPTHEGRRVFYTIEAVEAWVSSAPWACYGKQRAKVGA
jgi:hypothetical protein